MQEKRGLLFHLLLGPPWWPSLVQWITVVSFPQQHQVNYADDVPSDHWHDVVVGSLLGLVFSYFSYRQYYPSLADPLAHRPYSPRIKRAQEDTIPSYHDRHESFPDGHHRPAGEQPSSPSEQRYEVQDLAVEGTVPRPGPNRISDLWSDQDENVDGSRQSGETV